MKKIIISLAAIFTLSAFAQNQYNIDVSNTTMPSDEQIMQVIEKFNFDSSQKEYLFKETKRQLEEAYQNNQLNVDKDAFNKAQEMISGTPGTSETSPEVEPETQVQTIPQATSEKRVKKYSKHDPLFKKRSYSKKY